MYIKSRVNCNYCEWILKVDLYVHKCNHCEWILKVDLYVHKCNHCEWILKVGIRWECFQT